jgi:hypothetical protein
MQVYRYEKFLEQYYINNCYSDVFLYEHEQLSDLENILGNIDWTLFKTNVTKPNCPSEKSTNNI